MIRTTEGNLVREILELTADSALVLADGYRWVSLDHLLADNGVEEILAANRRYRAKLDAERAARIERVRLAMIEEAVEDAAAREPVMLATDLYSQVVRLTHETERHHDAAP